MWRLSAVPAKRLWRPTANQLAASPLYPQPPGSATRRLIFFGMITVSSLPLQTSKPEVSCFSALRFDASSWGADCQTEDSVNSEDHDHTPLDTYRQYEDFEIDWCGIRIRVRFQRVWLGTPRLSHLTLEHIMPERAPLSVTDTGFRSHFPLQSDIDAAGGPVAFARAWLEEKAKSPNWRKAQAQARQLKLF